jgi:light-harvesting complex 1 beta chain
MHDEKLGLTTYLTEKEAKEFQTLFVVSMAFFVGMAVIAHFLVWTWRPWFPGTEPYKAGMAMSAPVLAKEVQKV